MGGKNKVDVIGRFLIVYECLHLEFSQDERRKGEMIREKNKGERMKWKEKWNDKYKKEWRKARESERKTEQEKSCEKGWDWNKEFVEGWVNKNFSL